MLTLTELHQKAKAEQWAVPHFNFASLAQLHGIIDAARELNAPVLVGTSEGEREFVGMKQAVALVRSFREEGVTVYLNADHCHSVESALEAFEAGYDSIHADLSKLPFEENIQKTKQIVEYVKSKRSEVEVEAELGYLVTDSSKIYDEVIEIPEDAYTRVDEAVRFVEETGIDRFAPSIGNLHGISANTPKIRFELIEELKNVLPERLTFTLHGGSGITDEDLQRIVSLGFNNVHISTELREAFTRSLQDFIKQHPNALSPYEYLKPAREAAKELVKEKLQLYKTVNVL